MISIRELASCIGLSGTISILGDFFGFLQGRLPPDPIGATVSVSLWHQAQRLKGEHYHLNVIRIGSDNFTDNDYIAIDYAIYRIRNIYDQVGVGIGRVEHYYVTTADAMGLDAPTTKQDLKDISNTWTVRNNGIDVFIPLNMNVPSNSGNILGRSPRPGPCEEKDDWGMNGSVVGLWGSEQTARTFSHEVGHYLDLEHKNDWPDNLMCQSGEVVAQGGSIRDSVNLTSEQGNDINEHCLVWSGC